MEEIFGLLIILAALFFTYYVVKNSGYYSTSSVYTLFLLINIIIYFLIINKIIVIKSTGQAIFTAMPIYNYNNKIILSTMLYYLFLMFLGVLSVKNIKTYKKYVIEWNISEKLLNKIIFSPFIFLFLMFMLLFGIIYLYEINKTLLWSNNQYLIIGNPEAMGISSLVSRIYHYIITPIGMIFFSLSIFYYKKKNFVFFIPCSLLASLGFIKALAADSRWVPLYFLGVVLMNIIISNRFYGISNLVYLCLAFFGYLKVIIGRNMYYHGISHIFDAFNNVSIHLFINYFFGIIINIFQSPFGFANSLLLKPNFNNNYKLLSFSPLISSIDGFNNIKDLYAINISKYVPMNAYSEVWNFGLIYLLIFSIAIVILLREATSCELCINNVFSIFILFPSYLVIFLLSQYPVRASWRLILLLILFSSIIKRVIIRRNSIKEI